MKPLTLRDACIALDIDEATLYRWCRVAGIHLGTDSYDKRRRMITTAQVQRLAELHHIPFDATQEKQEPSPDEMLHRLDAIKERLDALEHQIGDLHTELRLVLDLLQRPQQPQPSQPHQIPTTSKQPLSAPYESQKEVATLPEGAMLLFAFARLHNVHGQDGLPILNE